MNNLVAPDPRRLGRIDGGKNLITHFTCQALIRQASDSLTLFPTSCLPADLEVDAAIQVVPK